MTALLPPAVIGIIGGGQLGMMTVREAQRMGYRTVVWDPNPECPASRLADEVIAAPFNDLNAATIFGDNVDVATYEFENIESAAVEKVERSVPVYPGSVILKIAQHRREEKTELARRGFPVVAHRVATSKKEIEDAVAALGFPVVVKTTTSGYDGKGQSVLRSNEEVKRFLQQVDVQSKEYVVEQYLNLRCELSCIAVRNTSGTVVAFPISENAHRNNILHKTVVPARIPETVTTQAQELGKKIIESFHMVGVLCVEMFVTNDDVLLVNELAPRPHNSGHYTLDACSYSQFEALVRSVCGLSTPEPELTTPCAMVNLLGKHLQKLDIPALSSERGVKLHLYGKKKTETNRKMGHVTILGKSSSEVDRKVTWVEQMIGESNEAL